MTVFEDTVDGTYAAFGVGPTRRAPRIDPGHAWRQESRERPLLTRLRGSFNSSRWQSRSGHDVRHLVTALPGHDQQPHDILERVDHGTAGVPDRNHLGARRHPGA